MTYCEAILHELKTTDPDLAATMEHSLAGWNRASGAWRRVLENLCADPALPQDIRKRLMQIVAEHPTDEDALGQAYRKECWCHSRIGPVWNRLPEGRAVWNSVSEPRLLHRLGEALGAEDATRFLDRLKGALAGADQNQPMAEYSMWATWRQDVTGAPVAGNPFEDWYKADHVRSRLGLDQLEIGQPLWLFHYALPEGMDAHVPTVADAGTFPYFRPNTLPNGHGMTEPWPVSNSLHDAGGAAPFQPRPCPEVVHQAVKFTQMREALCLEP